MFPASLSPPPLLASLLPLLGTTLFGCPSIIHTHISINIQASRFPVARVRSAAVRRTPASQPGRNGLLLMAPSGPFLRLSITITFCQLRRRRNAKSQTVATAPGPQQQQQQQQTQSEATKVPPTRVAKEKKRQWSSKRLKPYWYLLCIFVYSINSEVLGKSEQNPFVCS